MNTKLVVSVCAVAALLAACNKREDTATAPAETPPPPAETPPPADTQPPPAETKPTDPPPSN